ncbi:MAG: acyl-homoserine-lactone synthase [Novosphingobium sp.]|nr:autoinducer synthase [Novosphingobium sp.]
MSLNARYITDYTRSEIVSDAGLLRTMHEDRKSVFIDTLQWPLTAQGSLEIDEFDHADAVYLAGKDYTGVHRASIRLLDTEGRHMLADLFPYLCEGEIPRGPDIKEVTRYTPSPRAKASERLIWRNMMARAVIEYGLLTGIRAYTAVCDISFLSQLLSVGWRCDPLGLPQSIDGSAIGAFIFYVEEDSLSKFKQSWRYPRTAYSVTPKELQHAA